MFCKGLISVHPRLLSRGAATRGPLDAIRLPKSSIRETLTSG